MSADASVAVTGLDPAQAAARLRDEGPNELGLSQRRTLRDIAWEVLREPMFGLLLGAGAIYLAMGDAREALILLGFVFIIMGITALQERRTDKALDALRDLSSPRALSCAAGRPIASPAARWCAKTCCCWPKATACRPTACCCRRMNWPPTSRC